MTPRKPKVPTARRPKHESGTTDAFVEAVRGFGITLEDVRSQMKVVIEALQECATKRELEELRGEFAELRGEMKVVIEALHDRPTRRELEGRFDRIDGEIGDLRREVASQKQGAEIRALEQRVTVLEQG